MSSQFSNKNERGSVFIILMGACILFGALMFTYSRISGSASSGLDNGKAKLAASELLDYTSRMVSAIAKLQSNGCSEIDISFSPPPYTTTVNPNSPTDQSCHVFSPQGGNMVPMDIAKWKGIDVATLPLAWPSSGIHYQGACMSIAGNGPTNNKSDLGMWIANIERNTCKQINLSLGIPNPNGEPPVDNATQLGGGNFTGTYGTGNRDRQLWGSGNEFVGKTAGCYSSTNYNLPGCPGCLRYYFAATLIPR